MRERQREREGTLTRVTTRLLRNSCSMTSHPVAATRKLIRTWRCCLSVKTLSCNCYTSDKSILCVIKSFEIRTTKNIYFLERIEFESMSARCNETLQSELMKHSSELRLFQTNGHQSLRCGCQGVILRVINSVQRWPRFARKHIHRSWETSISASACTQESQVPRRHRRNSLTVLSAT